MGRRSRWPRTLQPWVWASSSHQKMEVKNFNTCWSVCKCVSAHTYIWEGEHCEDIWEDTDWAWHADWELVTHTYMCSPVTLTLTSRCLSVDTGREDRLVTTPLFTVLGTTADSLLELRWREGVTLVCFLISLGVWRKSWTNSSQSNMRNTRRLLRTTVKQDESFVDLQGKRFNKKIEQERRNVFYEVASVLLSLGRCFSSIF